MRNRILQTNNVNPQWKHRVRTENLPFRVDGTDIELTLDALQTTDCSGLGDGSTVYDQWMFYYHTSVVVLCLDVTDTYVESDIMGHWGPELGYFFRREKWSGDKVERIEHIREDCLKEGKKVPFLLVGCQIDTRTGGNEAITFEQV